MLPRALPLILLVVAIIAVGSYVTVNVLAEGCATVQLNSPTGFDVGIGPTSLVNADFNHDNKIDVAVASSGNGLSSDGSISILLNNGNGGFSPATTIPIGISTSSIVTTDFNKDGNPDLAVIHYIPASCCTTSFVTVFLGNATGGFTAAAGSPFAVGGNASNMVVGDFNRDTNPDVAVSRANGFAVLFGDGTGFLGTRLSFGGFSQFIAVADMNNDAKLDVVVGSAFSQNVNVFLGDGLGGFTNIQPTTDTGDFVRYVVLGDFNEDSKIDVATATSGKQVRMLPGTGDGKFGAPVVLNVDSPLASLLAQDINGDGHLDLIGAGQNGCASVLKGDGHGGFSAAQQFVAGLSLFAISAAEITGDTRLDLIAADASANRLVLLAGDGAGNFGARTFPGGNAALISATADLNHDGRLDLVQPNVAGGAVSVLLNTGGGTFSAPNYFSIDGSAALDLEINDFNHDGNLDLVTANVTSASLLLGEGNGGFASPIPVIENTNVWTVTSADFNKDGNADLAIGNNTDRTVLILLGNGFGMFGAPSTYNVSGSPTDIESADINGDGNADLIVATGIVSVLIGNGDGTFAPDSPLLAQGGIVSLTTGDVNGDGLVDVLGANPQLNQLSLFLGNSTGFEGENTFAVPTPHRVAFADLNGDGKTDLLASSGNSSLVVMTGDGFGFFSQPLTFIAGSGPNGVLPIDANGDGRLEVVITNNAGIAVLSSLCNATPAVVPTLSIGDVTIAEGNSGQTNAVFTVSLSASSTQIVTVSYYTNAETASELDFQSRSGRLMFAPGVITQTISVPVIGDNVVEPNETFGVSLFSPLNAVLGKAKGTGTIANDETSVGFQVANFEGGENASPIINVVRTGDLNIVTTVDFATSDTAGAAPCNAVTGVASSRCDYLRKLGRLTFGTGESSKTILVPVVDDAFVEGNESFSITLSNVTNAILQQGTATITIQDNDSAAGPNPIDDASFFVRQHYVDFLNRLADTDGLNFWTNQITSCGANAQCVEEKRINVSAAFFLSIEFQETGYHVYRVYKTAFGNLPGAPVPLVLTDFLRDTQQIQQGVQVGIGNWQQQLETNKQAYALAFVRRADFQTAFPNSMTAQQFVDQLNQRAGLVLSPSENADLVAVLGATPADQTKRAQVLRAVAEDSDLRTAEFNKAFVLMQYFGYLRRNPNDLPDANYDGFNFWLTKLNNFNGNYVAAEMVKAFLVSGEYRQRFGP